MSSLNEADVERYARELNGVPEPPLERVNYRAISSIEAKPIEWLWPGRIALGKVSMIAGNPGLGKSQLSAYMAANVSLGRPWTDGTIGKPGNVVIVSAEDDAADTIRPRLEAAGADIERVFLLDSVVEGYTGEGKAVGRMFNLSSDIDRLAEMLDAIGGARLVVIDPITAYLGGTDSHKNADIRGLLAPLSEMAAKRGAAVVCISHLNKSGGAEALMRITGSLAFVAAARSAWLVVKDAADDDRRLFLSLKNNLAEDRGGLSFRIEGVAVNSAAGMIATSKIAWEPGSVTITAQEAMAADVDGDHSERAEAKEFLSDFLSEMPQTAKHVRDAARAAGISERTLKRAKKDLGVKSEKDGMMGGWTWSLPKGAKGSPSPNLAPFAPLRGQVAPFDDHTAEGA